MTNDFFDDENEQEKKQSSEFAKMLEDSFKNTRKSLSMGDKIQSEILSIGKEEVFVTTGTMIDGIVPRKELLDSNGQMTYKVGDTLELYVTQARGSSVYLSPKPTAKNIADSLEDAYDMMLPVEGRVTEVCKGGVRVSLMGKSAFCPISQLDSKRIDTADEYVGKRFEFLITQFSEGGRNIVVSRRKFLDEQKGMSENAFVEEHKKGDVLTGTITRIEKFGAFVELGGGVEGLVHVSEIGWSRVSDPHEIVQLGQHVQVKVLSFEEKEGKLRVSLSMKQAEGQPWDNLPSQIQVGQVVNGKVTRCMKFGAFVELAPGIEGLIPLSEMSYTKRVVRSDECIKEGDKISVMIKDIQPDQHRIQLSLRDASGDPWAMVPYKFTVGTIAKGKVERKEPYGLFVQLDEGIVGLLPKSKAIEEPQFGYEKLKVGDEVVVQVGELFLDDRKMSLTVPQDPGRDDWKSFAQESSKSFGTLGDQFKNFFDKKKTGGR